MFPVAQFASHHSPYSLNVPLIGSRRSFASISASKRWPSSWLSTCCLICEGVCKLVQFNSLAPGKEIQKAIAEQKRLADKLKDLE